MTKDLFVDLNHRSGPSPSSCLHVRPNSKLSGSMTNLSPRQQLIKELNGKIDEALQCDFEHGVKALNIAAAEEFHRKYPALIEVFNWLAFLSYEELPND
jgi:hypothetical protein